jgi:hypothetical protein
MPVNRAMQVEAHAIERRAAASRSSIAPMMRS